MGGGWGDSYVRAGCEDNLTVALLAEDCVKPRQHRVTAVFFWGGRGRRRGEIKGGREGGMGAHVSIAFYFLLLCLFEYSVTPVQSSVLGVGVREGGKTLT